MSCSGCFVFKALDKGERIGLSVYYKLHIKLRSYLCRGKTTAVDMLTGFAVLLVLHLPVICQGKILLLEAKRARGVHVKHVRSNSTFGTTVLLQQNDTLSLTFCLRRDDNHVGVAGVVFSNDGKAETCRLTLDRSIKTGKFASVSESDYGKLWNVFRNSGQIGKFLNLKKGVHSMKIECDTVDGIEIDVIKFEIFDDLLTQDIFECRLQCQSASALKKHRKPNLYSRNATVSQRSYKTNCAEEDNVHIPMYMTNVANYTITASLPTYQTFNNKRAPDETNCIFLPPLHWKFENVGISSSNKSVNTSGAVMRFMDQHKMAIVSAKWIEVTFLLDGPSRGYIDSEIGSFMVLNILPVKYALLINGKYIGRRNIHISLAKKYLLPGQRKLVYDFPDFTWTETYENIITLELYAIFPIDVVIKEMRMERRPMKPDRSFSIYSSDELIIEGIDVDFWWREPEKMIARRLDTGETWDDVDFFRISAPVPWADGYAQVFVLYQDGNARLLRIPPNGLNWIPFGSSVIIGQTDPRSFRPSAPIRQVDFNPDDLTMILTYRDGGSVKLSIEVETDQTVLTVSKIQYGKNPYFPFATFRSMYVEDGNSDCDRVMVDDDAVYNIMDPWRATSGRIFTFFRECESKHLTLSPDIRVEVTGVY